MTAESGISCSVSFGPFNARSCASFPSQECALSLAPRAASLVSSVPVDATGVGPSGILTPADNAPPSASPFDAHADVRRSPSAHSCDFDFIKTLSTLQNCFRFAAETIQIFEVVKTSQRQYVELLTEPGRSEFIRRPAAGVENKKAARRGGLSIPRRDEVPTLPRPGPSSGPRSRLVCRSRPPFRG